MTRGNQRERDRKKTEAENNKLKSANTLSGSKFAQKKEDDAAKMRAKQAKADADKAATGQTVGAKKKK
ncbi:hypothetical protein BJX99DRAFT_254915 [Aspergillus californicus]